MHLTNYWNGNKLTSTPRLPYLLLIYYNAKNPEILLLYLRRCIDKLVETYCPRVWFITITHDYVVDQWGRAVFSSPIHTTIACFSSHKFILTSTLVNGFKRKTVIIKFLPMRPFVLLLFALLLVVEARREYRRHYYGRNRVNRLIIG
jgi:hypothetical protein